MKERNLFYFITAVVATVYFIVTLLIRFMPWYNLYGILVLPELHKLVIPVILLWLAWYFENKHFLLASTIVYTVLFGFHMDQAGLLNGGIFVVSTYAPMVRTVYVLGFLLMLGIVGLGFFNLYMDQKNEKKA